MGTTAVPENRPEEARPNTLKELQRVRRAAIDALEDFVVTIERLHNSLDWIDSNTTATPSPCSESRRSM